MKKHHIGGRIFMALVFLFLYAPIFVLVVFSFNSTKSRTVWTGFSLRWYTALFKNATILNSFSTTIIVSVLAAVIATVAGTLAAIGFYNMKRRPRGFFLSINNIPVINADIITGVSLMLLFVFARTFTGLDLGFVTLLLAHISFNIPYVILSVMPKLQQLDPNLFEAAQDLGATSSQALLRVIIPEISPGVITGLMIAFTMSIDDFVISYFTAGSEVSTLSMTIYSMTRKRISPEINALSTILFASVLILLLIINFRQSRQDREASRRDSVLMSISDTSGSANAASAE